ncbi:MAG: hypothetical protein WCF22_20715 [Candidatus Sulfotelmatobacter sp.]
MTRITIALACTLAVALCATSAWAQSAPAPDTLKVDYFANAHTDGAPDATLRITNPGTSGISLCASIYVFDTTQEMSECCSCYISADGLRTLSVNTNLTSNPLTGVSLSTGVIKMVSTLPKGGVCPLPGLSPTPAVRAWATHIQNTDFTITETASQDATLSAAEVARLERGCSSILNVGSGAGICSCGTGG